MNRKRHNGVSLRTSVSLAWSDNAGFVRFRQDPVEFYGENRYSGG